MRNICRLVTLHVLSLGPKTQLTDRGLKQLWRLQRLNQFDLYSPKITGSGFGPMTELPKLGVLRLSSPKLTDDAFGYLSETPELTYVEIGWNVEENSPALTDEGLQILADKANWGSININRRGTAITDAGLQRLRQSPGNPQVQVKE